MIPHSLSALANHLWQSTLFVGLAGSLTLALRKNSARVRYWVWVAASLKFLIPFSLLIAVGGRFEWRTAQAIAPNVSLVMQQVSQPFAATTVSSPGLATVPPAPNPLPTILFGAWACGFIGISISWFLRWRQISSAVRAGSPAQLGLPIQAISSPSFLETGILGLFRPVLLLPEGILDHLSPEQWKSIVAHELCHVRHRDNLVGVVQMSIETVFWFHPLLWWIGKRIVQERECACDEEVLRLGSEPKEYAQGILKVCELYLESPVSCVAGVSGSNFRKRIEGIMNNRPVIRMNAVRKAVLIMGATASILVPLVLGILNAPAIRGQSRPATAKFEVASIKATDESGARMRPMPGGLTAMAPLRVLMEAAYQVQDFEIVGWLKSDGYEIDAKTSHSATPAQTMLMLQSLLEERFQLRVHRESREMPVYTLVAARGGLKLASPREGSCVADECQGRPSRRCFEDAGGWQPSYLALSTLPIEQIRNEPSPNGGGYVTR